MNALHKLIDDLEQYGADVELLKDVSVYDNAYKALPIIKVMLHTLPASERLDELQNNYCKIHDCLYQS